jgi:hypothetical protein
MKEKIKTNYFFNIDFSKALLRNWILINVIIYCIDFILIYLKFYILPLSIFFPIISASASFFYCMYYWYIFLGYVQYYYPSLESELGKTIDHNSYELLRNYFKNTQEQEIRIFFININRVFLIYSLSILMEFVNFFLLILIRTIFKWY